MEGLIGALKIIKEECEKHDTCRACPLHVIYDNCVMCGLFGKSPNRYELNPDNTSPNIFEG